MICTVSTVLESVENLAVFVQSNLAMGVDHMFLVIDAPDRPGQAEIAEYFAEHPHVTTISGDPSWWPRGRPGELNRRQIINANRVLWAMRETTPDHWLFHIDADEVLALGPDRLDHVPPRRRGVRVRPAEAVAVWDPPAYETRFKPAAKHEQLEHYAALGLIPTPEIRYWLHGYRSGKVGVRVNSGFRLAIHQALDPDGNRLYPPVLRGAWVLHHHIRSGSDAVAKATAFALNSHVGLAPHKREWVEALQALATETDESRRRAREREIFDQHLADPVDLMEAHGVLLQIDPREHNRTPELLSEEHRRVIAERLPATLNRRHRLFRLALPARFRTMFGEFRRKPPKA